MNMYTIKTILYNFLLGTLIFYITSQIVGIETSGIVSHWLMAAGAFVAANLLVPYLLKFFTLPKNFLTYWLAGTIMSIAAFYIISLFLPGITFEETVLEPSSLGIISINSYTLTPFMTMTFAGIIAGLMSAAFYWLQSE